MHSGGKIEVPGSIIRVLRGKIEVPGLIIRILRGKNEGPGLIIRVLRGKMAVPGGFWSELHVFYVLKRCPNGGPE